MQNSRNVVNGAKSNN